MPRHPRKTLLWVGLYGLALLLIGLWPTHVDQNFDVVKWAPVQWLTRHFDLTWIETYRLVEFTANVALFVPLGVIAMTWSSRSRWIHAVLLGVAVSGAIEIMQDVARPGRTATWNDIVANTAGAALGAALVLLWRSGVPRALAGTRERY